MSTPTLSKQEVVKPNYPLGQIDSRAPQTLHLDPKSTAASLVQELENKSTLYTEKYSLEGKLTKLKDGLKNVALWILGIFTLFIPQIIAAIQKGVTERKLQKVEVEILKAGDRIKALQDQLKNAQAALKKAEEGLKKSKTNLRKATDVSSNAKRKASSAEDIYDNQQKKRARLQTKLTAAQSKLEEAQKAKELADNSQITIWESHKGLSPTSVANNEWMKAFANFYANLRHPGNNNQSRNAIEAGQQIEQGQKELLNAQAAVDKACQGTKRSYDDMAHAHGEEAQAAIDQASAEERVKRAKIDLQVAQVEEENLLHLNAEPIRDQKTSGNIQTLEEILKIYQTKNQTIDCGQERSAYLNWQKGISEEEPRTLFLRDYEGNHYDNAGLIEHLDRLAHKLSEEIKQIKSEINSDINKKLHQAIDDLTPDVGLRNTAEPEDEEEIDPKVERARIKGESAKILNLNNAVERMGKLLENLSVKKAFNVLKEGSTEVSDDDSDDDDMPELIGVNNSGHNDISQQDGDRDALVPYGRARPPENPINNTQYGWKATYPIYNNFFHNPREQFGLPFQGYQTQRPNLLVIEDLKKPPQVGVDNSGNNNISGQDDDDEEALPGLVATTRTHNTQPQQHEAVAAQAPATNRWGGFKTFGSTVASTIGSGAKAIGSGAAAAGLRAAAAIGSGARYTASGVSATANLVNRMIQANNERNERFDNSPVGRAYNKVRKLVDQRDRLQKQIRDLGVLNGVLVKLTDFNHPSWLYQRQLNEINEQIEVAQRELFDIDPTFNNDRHGD